MKQRQFTSEDIIVEQDIFSGNSKVIAELANWSLGHGGAVMDSIVVSYDKTPEEILQLISNVKNTIITNNGEIGTTANGNKTYKIGEYLLIASAEHCFNAVVCCFDGSHNYNLNNSNDCGVYNAAFEVSMAIRTVSVPGSVKAISFFATSDNGFISVSFNKNPIAQQVYDSEFWNGDPNTTTTITPDWFSLLMNNKGNTASGKSGGCYVATAVYGSYDCPQVWTLRRYRDYKLANTWYGRAFVRTYYFVSPTLVKWFGNADWFVRFFKAVLDKKIKKLQELGYKSTSYIDKNW